VTPTELKSSRPFFQIITVLTLFPLPVFSFGFTTHFWTFFYDWDVITRHRKEFPGRKYRLPSDHGMTMCLLHFGLPSWIHTIFIFTLDSSPTCGSNHPRMKQNMNFIKMCSRAVCVPPWPPSYLTQLVHNREINKCDTCFSAMIICLQLLVLIFVSRS
jgi:hypothetical protein